MEAISRHDHFCLASIQTELEHRISQIVTFQRFEKAERSAGASFDVIC